MSFNENGTSISIPRYLIGEIEYGETAVSYIEDWNSIFKMGDREMKAVASKTQYF